MCKKRFRVIGMPDNNSLCFSGPILDIIRQGAVFSGGRRHHELVREVLPERSEWIDVSVPLSDVFARYEAYDDIVFFASGDPLFYGYAVTLQREFPDADIKVFPYFNSLQMLAHRMLLAYAGMENVSLTGRSWKNLDIALMEDRELIGVLTDRTKNPSAIAARMLRYGYYNYSMTVGESLGREDSERVLSLTLEEAQEMKFNNPNCVILRKTGLRRRFRGIPESEFSHLEGRGNMITKMPVRLLTVSMLDLWNKHSFWDVGFCTGSVSIEAQLAFPRLEVTAFERREESRHLLEENCRKFGAMGINGVIGDFMELDAENYPKPDAVFIGGHGGRLMEMVEKIDKVLLPDGVIVFNSVNEGSLESFRKAIEKCGRKIEAAHRIALDGYNPITIMKAR